MKGDKIPLCEPEYINESRRIPAKKTYTSTSIVVLLIFLLFTIFTLMSWYNIESKWNIIAASKCKIWSGECSMTSCIAI